MAILLIGLSILFVCLISVYLGGERNWAFLSKDYQSGNPSRLHVQAQGTFTTKNTSENESTLEEYIDNTIFIGDSRTRGLATYHYLPQDNVYAVNGLSHQVARNKRFIDLNTGEELTIAEAIGIKKPSRMIVAFGINGLAYMGEENFINEYASFLDELKAQSPNTTLIVQSVLPVSSEKAKDDPRMSNEVIDRYNTLLKNLIGEKGGFFWNVSPGFKDSQNALSPEYDSGDGLHFNKTAYERYIQCLDAYRKQ